MNLELISFKICPFVQRSVLTLLCKGIPYKITYIDLTSPPDWFKQISPFGKVPVLKVDDQHVIFESAVINEYLDELLPESLLPIEPLQRAISRSWIDFGSKLTLDFSGLIHSADTETFDSKLQTVKQELDWLEGKLGQGPWFNNEDYSLVDIAYAPLFMRADLLSLEDFLYPKNNYPKVSAWADKLIALPELGQSVVNDFEVIFKRHIMEKAPYVADRIKLEL